MLSENGELILKNKEIANTFNDHFGSIVDNLSLDHWYDHFQSPTMGSDRIDNIIKRYKNHPSIKWLVTCAWKSKVPGSSPAASYVQR